MHTFRCQFRHCVVVHDVYVSQETLKDILQSYNVPLN